MAVLIKELCRYS